MSNMANYTFTEIEKEQVRQAVKSLETVSCGEIVPYIVDSSDDYVEASWYMSTIMGSVMATMIGLFSYSWMLPFHLTPVDIAIGVMAAIIVGFFIPVVFPSSKRWLITKERQLERVNQRAAEAFLNEKVYKTAEKVGILLFVSQQERLVLVMGDEGINARVSQKDWEEVVEVILSGIKSRQAAQGLVNAIDRCRELLLRHGFVRKATDTNELSDDLRIEA